jgi:hypothetical protein
VRTEGGSTVMGHGWLQGLEPGWLSLSGLYCACASRWRGFGAEGFPATGRGLWRMGGPRAGPLVRPGGQTPIFNRAPLSNLQASYDGLVRRGWGRPTEDPPSLAALRPRPPPLALIAPEPRHARRREDCSRSRVFGAGLPDTAAGPGACAA